MSVCYDIFTNIYNTRKNLVFVHLRTFALAEGEKIYYFSDNVTACKNIKTESHIFHILFKHFFVTQCKYCNFHHSKAPVTILVTDVTNPNNLTNNMLAHKLH